MRRAYRVLAYIIAVEVAIQAAAIAWMMAGLAHWVQQGGVLDKAVMDDRSGPPAFFEVLAMAVHGINGQMLIPLLAVLLLILGFFTHIRHAVLIGACMVGLVALQVALAMVAHGGVPIGGLLHGANALLIFATALLATHIARPGASTQDASTRAHAVG